MIKRRYPRQIISSGPKITRLKSSTTDIINNNVDVDKYVIKKETLEILQNKQENHSVVFQKILRKDGNTLLIKTKIKVSELKLSAGKNKGKDYRVTLSNQNLKLIKKRKTLNIKKNNNGLKLEKIIDNQLKEGNLLVLNHLSNYIPLNKDNYFPYTKSKNIQGPIDYTLYKDIFLSIKGNISQRCNKSYTSLDSFFDLDRINFLINEIKLQMIKELGLEETINLEKTVKFYSKSIYNPDNSIGFNNYKTKESEELKNELLLGLINLKNKLIEDSVFFSHFLFNYILNISDLKVYELQYNLNNMNSNMLPEKIIEIPSIQNFPIKNIKCEDFKFNLMKGSGTGFNLEFFVSFEKNNEIQTFKFSSTLRYCNRFLSNLRFQTGLNHIKNIESLYKVLYDKKNELI